MGNQRLFVLRGAVGCAAGGGDYMGREEGREGGGSRLFADTLSDSVGAELERPASVRRVLLLAQAARLPRSPREGALLVVGAVRIRDAGHEGGNTRRGEVIRVLQSPNILEHLLHAALGSTIRFVSGSGELGKRHRCAGVVARGARDGAEGRDDQFPDHFLETLSLRGGAGLEIQSTRVGVALRSLCRSRVWSAAESKVVARPCASRQKICRAHDGDGEAGPRRRDRATASLVGRGGHASDVCAGCAVGRLSKRPCHCRRRKRDGKAVGSQTPPPPAALPPWPSL